MATLEELSKAENYGNYDTLPDEELLSVLETAIGEFEGDSKRFQEELILNRSVEEYITLARGVRKISTSIVESFADVEYEGWSYENLVRLDNILKFSSIVCVDAAEFLVRNNSKAERDIIHFYRHAATHDGVRVILYTKINPSPKNINNAVEEITNFLDSSLINFEKALSFLDGLSKPYHEERYSIYISRMVNIVNWFKLQPNIFEGLRKDQLQDYHLLGKILTEKQVLVRNLKQRFEICKQSIISATDLLAKFSSQDFRQVWTSRRSLNYFAKSVIRAFDPLINAFAYNSGLQGYQTTNLKAKYQSQANETVNTRIMISWQYYKILNFTGIDADIWEGAVPKNFRLNYPIEISLKTLETYNLRESMELVKALLPDVLFKDMYSTLKDNFPDLNDLEIEDEIIRVLSTDLYPTIELTTRNQVKVYIKKLKKGRK